MNKTNDKKFIIGILKYFASTIFIVFFIVIVFNFYKNFKLENNIEKNIYANEIFKFNDFFGKEDKVCIIPPYNKFQSIQSFINKQSYAKLDTTLNRYFYQPDDTFWLIIKVDTNNNISLFKIHGNTRPVIKTGICLNADKAVLSFKERNIYTFFTFYEE